MQLARFTAQVVMMGHIFCCILHNFLCVRYYNYVKQASVVRKVQGYMGAPAESLIYGCGDGVVEGVGGSSAIAIRGWGKEATSNHNASTFSP